MSENDSPDKHPLGFELPPPVVVSRSRLLFLAFCAVGIAGAAMLLRYVPKEHERAALAAESITEGRKARRVEVVRPTPLTSTRAIVLPASVQPLEETVLYARSTGYVRKWYADIGDRVKEGALLAEIDTPELDQELMQSRAQLVQTQASLAQTKASRDLAKMNLARAVQLAPAVVSQAELDQTRAQAEVSEANVHVAEANVAAQEAAIRRLVQLKDFARVTAPFAGTITQRAIERGSLLTGANTQPLYKLAATDPVRVFAQVPQGLAPSVRAGRSATVTVREYPGREFKGVVARASGELDSATRTMNTEVRVPNGDGALMPGMYAEIAIDLPAPHTAVQVPATTLLNDARGQRVAIVDADRHLHLVPVVIERDNGSTIDIATGLTGAEDVVTLASAAFMEGEEVVVASAPAPSLK